MNMEGDWDEIEVPISALEHFSYCPRQCALIHVEQVYEENIFTVRGSIAHERVHSGDDAPIRGVEVRRAMPLVSVRLGLVGKADIVEMRPEGPYPVEYKSGRKHHIHAELQLCAQALCLEEMFGQAVPFGAVFSHASRTRKEVRLDEELRSQTLSTLAAVRQMLIEQRVPAPLEDRRKCRNCSLQQACLPDVVMETARLRGLQSALFQPYD